MTTPMRDAVLSVLRRFKEVGPSPETRLPLPCGGRLEPVSWADGARPEATTLLAKWREKANPFFPSQFPVTLEGTHRWLVKGLLEAADRILFWVKTAEGAPVGHVGLFRFDFDKKSAEADNIVRGEDGVQPGLIQGAMAAMLDWAFNALGCDATTLRVMADNDRAIRLYRRLGYEIIARVPLRREESGDVVQWVETAAAEGGPATVRHLATMRLAKHDWIGAAGPPALRLAVTDPDCPGEGRSLPESVEDGMNKTVVLLANDRPGLEVCRHLRACGDTIVRLYVHEPERQKYGDEIIRASGCAPEDVYLAPLLKDRRHVARLAALQADYIITVYWAYLISPDVIAAATEGTVNFHPAMLPVNRGWFPHVHSILDGSPTGVTLHAIDANADTGPVWAQRPVPLRPLDTAYTIYNRLQHEIVALFRETWPKIKAGAIVPTPQDESRAVYHKKSEIGNLDKLDLNAVMRVGDVINLLRARSFGDHGFAYYEQDGQRVYVKLCLSASNSFHAAPSAHAA